MRRINTIMDNVHNLMNRAYAVAARRNPDSGQTRRSSLFGANNTPTTTDHQNRDVEVTVTDKTSKNERINWQLVTELSIDNLTEGDVGKVADLLQQCTRLTSLSINSRSSSCIAKILTSLSNAQRNQLTELSVNTDESTKNEPLSWTEDEQQKIDQFFNELTSLSIVTLGDTRLTDTDTYQI